MKEDQFHLCYPINEVSLFGIKPREAIYNRLIFNNLNRLMNAMARFAPKVFKMRTKDIEAYISREIEKFKPDIVISVIPYINLAASEAARKASLPFLLVTIDNDLEIWVNGLKKLTHPHFKVTIGSDLPTSRGRLEACGIKKENIKTIGLPLRPDFHLRKSKEELRAEYRIESEVPVVLLMMGGIGAKRAIKYAKKIAAMTFKIHLFICVGKNEQIGGRLKEIFLTSSSQLTVVSFTDKIPELMTLSDLLITKTGPGTINEAIATKTPVLLDETEVVLFWEKINIDLVLKRGIGRSIKNLSELESHMKELLFNPEVRAQLMEGLNRLPPNQFVQKIGPLIESLCEPAAQKEFVKIQ